jgi:preprotein translocase subunit SecA
LLVPTLQRIVCRMPADLGTSWNLVDSAHQTYLRWAGIPVEYDVRRYLEAVAGIEALRCARITDEELCARAAAVRDKARANALTSDAGRRGSTSSPRAPQRGSTPTRPALSGVEGLPRWGPRGCRAGDPATAEPVEGRTSHNALLDAFLPEVFAIAREAAARLLGMRPFDVQVAAGVALHEGKLAQMATGEGKTLVAVLPAVLNALGGRGVHIFTANDYLARRDAEWMGPVYRFFGLEVGFVVQGMTHDDRRRAYAADVTYVTAKEAGFDFLRDHTADDSGRVVEQRPRHAVIVDEADFILIDEARVPLVIAGSTPGLAIDHRRLAALVRELRRGIDYDADEYQRTVVLTEAGFRRAGKLLGGVRLDRPEQNLLLSAVHVALHAEILLKRDRDYIVRDGRVELVDEFTGRVAENRRWPHGIQPAVEAKEGVEVRPEGKILGSIPIQHFVRLYPKIAGMTATAVPAAAEFQQFFGLTTVVFPPNRPGARVDEDDVVFTHRAAKTRVLLDEIARVHPTGRPILVGTASVRESEELDAALKERGVKCRVLNARHDAREARIVARAGTLGAVTISTNMAGRGTDIVLGAGNPQMREQVLALGGLYVIGTNRHESRRIDDQLRGRAGRQADPGTSRFVISLEDDLIQRYGVLGLIPRAHRPAPQTGAVDDPIVRREIARAQRIIEGQNFEIRKTLWRYSQMVDEQRRMVYERRQAYLVDQVEPDACAEGAPEHYRALVEAAGPAAVRRAEQRLTMHLLDRAWSDHLGLIEDIREGIHLQRLGGREPLTEFSRQIIDAFAEMMDRVDEETVAIFQRLTAEGGEIDLARVGVGGSSSTWTYLVNDDPFSTLGTSLLASRTLTSAVGILAVMYWPITLVVTAGVLLRRWLRRRAQTEPPGEHSDEDRATKSG